MKSKPFNDPEVFARVRRLPQGALAAFERARDEAVARGVDVIDLSTDSPGVAPPAAVLDRLRSAAGDPQLHRAASGLGLAELRSAAARWFERRHGVELDRDREILATGGAREGVGYALLALLAEGDAVLVPAPSHPVYAWGALLAGAEPIPVTVGPGVDFFDSIVEATERVDRRAKGIVIEFPANPTGATATPELFAKIMRFAEARGMFVLSDLSASDLVLDAPPAPAALAVPGAKERTLEIVSLSRSHEVAGCQVGFCAGNAALVAAVARVKGALGDGPFAPAQAAAAVALDGCDEDLARMRERYRHRRDALVRRFAAAGWTVPVPAAAPFAWAPLPGPLRPLGSLEAARRLVEDAGVAVAPGIAFGREGEGSCRLTLIEDEARIELAAERIARLLHKGGK